MTYTNECLAYLTAVDMGGEVIGFGEGEQVKEKVIVCVLTFPCEMIMWEGDEACERCQDRRVDLCSGHWKPATSTSYPHLPYSTFQPSMSQFRTSTHQSPLPPLFFYNTIHLQYSIYIYIHISYLFICILQSLLII